MFSTPPVRTENACHADSGHCQQETKLYSELRACNGVSRSGRWKRELMTYYSNRRRCILSRFFFEAAPLSLRSRRGGRSDYAWEWDALSPFCVQCFFCWCFMSGDFQEHQIYKAFLLAWRLPEDFLFEKLFLRNYRKAGRATSYAQQREHFSPLSHQALLVADKRKQRALVFRCVENRNERQTTWKLLMKQKEGQMICVDLMAKDRRTNSVFHLSCFLKKNLHPFPSLCHTKSQRRGKRHAIKNDWKRKSYHLIVCLPPPPPHAQHPILGTCLWKNRLKQVL